jgi:hypothetical protein
MSVVAITICIVCQFVMVLGQLLLKHAINASEVLPRRWPKVLREFSLGIGCLTFGSSSGSGCSRAGR